jgi:hypothetical protein
MLAIVYQHKQLDKPYVKVFTVGTLTDMTKAIKVRNPFKNPIMRREFDSAVKAFEIKHRDLFVNGERRTEGRYGSSFASFFWHGYDGKTKGVAAMSNQASRAMIGYAYYRAGQLIRRAVA